MKNILAVGIGEYEDSQPNNSDPQIIAWGQNGSLEFQPKLKKCGSICQVVLSGVILRYIILTKICFYVPMIFIQLALMRLFRTHGKSGGKHFKGKRAKIKLRDFKYIYGLGLDDERFLAQLQLMSRLISTSFSFR